VDLSPLIILAKEPGMIVKRFGTLGKVECRDLEDAQWAAVWDRYCSTHLLPEDIPLRPDLVHRERWQGWRDFLGGEAGQVFRIMADEKRIDDYVRTILMEVEGLSSQEAEQWINEWMDADFLQHLGEHEHDSIQEVEQAVLSYYRTHGIRDFNPPAPN
jgi:hypothetical protein